MTGQGCAYLCLGIAHQRARCALSLVGRGNADHLQMVTGELHARPQRALNELVVLVQELYRSSDQQLWGYAKGTEPHGCAS